MKSFLRRIVPVLLFAAVLIAIHSITSEKSRVTQTPDEKPQHQASVEPRTIPEQGIGISPEIDTTGPDVAPVEASPPETMEKKPAGFITRTISSVWVDGVEKLSGRQRVRIVEADFKYPLLRLEEAVSRNPQTGEETVVLLRASVADHVMVGLKPDVDAVAATKMLSENGFSVRAAEEDSFLLAEIPGFEAAATQREMILKLEELSEFIDFAEPDYLVFPCLVPDDPGFVTGKMWGLHNPGNEAGSKNDADIDAPEK